MVASSASSLSGLLTGQNNPNALEKPWGVYFDPGLILGNQGSTADQTGYDFTMAGFTAGADYRVLRDLLLGVNTGYTYTSAGFAAPGATCRAIPGPSTPMRPTCPSLITPMAPWAMP